MLSSEEYFPVYLVDTPQLRAQREAELAFIKECRKIYRLAADRVLYDPEFKQTVVDNFARDAYFEGREVLRVVVGTWGQFLGYLKGEYEFSRWSGYGIPYYRSRLKGRGRLTSLWYDMHGNPDFREGLGYRRKPHHEKKAENPKAAWREHKQFNRDKANRGWRRMDKAGPHGKRQVAQARRRHDKRMIRQDRFDDVCPHNRGTKKIWWD